MYYNLHICFESLIYCLFKVPEVEKSGGGKKILEKVAPIKSHAI